MIARTNLRLDSRLARKPEKFSCAIPSVFMILFTLSREHNTSHGEIDFIVIVGSVDFV